MVTRGVLADLDRAVAAVREGDSIYLGGAVLDRKPMAFVHALAASGTRSLDVMSFAASIDVDVLIAVGSVRSVATAYTGLGRLGRAPAFSAAVTAGLIEDREYSEWTMLGGLRAAAMGVPFLPTRAAAGSQIVDIHDFRTVEDPLHRARVSGAAATPSGRRRDPRVASVGGGDDTDRLASGSPLRRRRAGSPRRADGHCDGRRDRSRWRGGGARRMDDPATRGCRHGRGGAPRCMAHRSLARRTRPITMSLRNIRRRARSLRSSSRRHDRRSRGGGRPRHCQPGEDDLAW